MVRGTRLKEEEIMSIGEKVCLLIEMEDYTVQSALKACGVDNVKTWAKWIKKYPKLEEMYKEAQVGGVQIQKLRLKKKGVKALENKLEDKKVTEEILIETYDAKGKKKGFQKKKTERLVPASTNAIIFAITQDSQSKNFQQKQHIDQNISGNINVMYPNQDKLSIDQIGLLDKLSILEIIIARVALKKGLDPLYFLNRLQNSIYSKFTGIFQPENDLNDTPVYPSQMVFDFDKIKKIAAAKENPKVIEIEEATTEVKKKSLLDMLKESKRKKK